MYTDKDSNLVSDLHISAIKVPYIVCKIKINILSLFQMTPLLFYWKKLLEGCDDPRGAEVKLDSYPLG